MNLGDIVRRGYKTTEFMLAVLTVLGVVATALVNSKALPPEWAAGVSAAIVVGYAVSRAIVKLGGYLAVARAVASHEQHGSSTRLGRN